MPVVALLLISLLATALAQVEKDISGNLEVQGRHAWNNDEAREDLLQDWKEEDFYLAYGNLNGKLEFKGSRLEANLFARYSYSELYRDPASPLVSEYFAPRIYTFPNSLVARDIFKLEHQDEGERSLTELVLNKFYYEWDYDEHRFMVGRMYINYGMGEIFNPVNPFNQPTGLTTISQVAQGNDGVNFKFFLNDRYTLDFYFLGDKSRDGYEGEIDRTLWIHGEYQLTESVQLDYVAGQDQQRLKAGGQVRFNFRESMIFLQTLYQSDFVDDEESHPLWDGMLGFDQQVNNKWHVRVEGGYQKQNRYAEFQNINERFLPTEYFIAFANQYEVHPLVKLSGTVVNDIKTGFTYFISRNTVDLGHDTELDLFAYLPAAKGSATENPAQKLVTTDVGIALRTFF